MTAKQIYLVLHNIRSVHNVGSIFRTADGAGVKKIFLCGITPTPSVENPKSEIRNSKKILNSKFETGAFKTLSARPSTYRVSALVQNSGKISKTALGAEKYVPWEYYKQTSRCLLEIKKQISKTRALKALSARPSTFRKSALVKIVALEQSPKSINIFKFKPQFPLVLIVGNEVKGLNKKILSMADKIVEIPMFGKKESLNVAVATGVALYQIKNAKIKM